MKTLCSLLVEETDVPLFELADVCFPRLEILRSFISIISEGLHYQSINKHHTHIHPQKQCKVSLNIRLLCTCVSSSDAQ